jgi:DGQHR domain-containing protein
MFTATSTEMEAAIMARPVFTPPAGEFVAPHGIPVVMGPKLIRSDVPIVCGFMPIGVLVPDNFVIPHHDPRTKKGYQRLPQESRINELVSDLRKGRVDLPTCVLLNVRNRDAKDAFNDGELDLNFFRGEAGTLSSSRYARNKFHVVDGQHRILAFEKLIVEGTDEDAARWSKFMIPFVCMLGATEEEEMDQFYIVNSKAKSVRTDLAYELLSQRAKRNPEVMEGLVERGRDWQVRAQEIVQQLSETSPVWKGRIRFASMEKGDTIMPSASMVASLKPLLNSPYFKILNHDQQVAVVDAFWRGLRSLMMDAFDAPGEFALQKGVGVMVMHNILVQVLEIVRASGMSVIEADSYSKILGDPLSNLQGDDSTGNPVAGIDFWRAAPHGAAGSYSSSAGRRVLMAKIQQVLPKVSVD